MNTTRILAALSLSLAALLTACGGGASADPIAPTSSALISKVVPTYAAGSVLDDDTMTNRELEAATTTQFGAYKNESGFSTRDWAGSGWSGWLTMQSESHSPTNFIFREKINMVPVMCAVKADSCFRVIRAFHAEGFGDASSVTATTAVFLTPVVVNVTQKKVLPSGNTTTVIVGGLVQTTSAPKPAPLHKWAGASTTEAVAQAADDKWILQYVYQAQTGIILK